jgi:hypothetical protein
VTELKYRACPYNSIALGFDTFLVSTTTNKVALVLQSELKRILDHCHISDTLEGLATRVTKRLNISEGNDRLVQRSLHELVRRGLLVPEHTVVIDRQVSTTHIPKITTLAFPTADRVVELQSAIASYADNVTKYGRLVDLLVMDDSKSVPRNDYLHSLNSVRTGLSIRYAGRPEKEAYLKALIDLGIQPDVARFALLGNFGDVNCTTGANRNAILLDTVGECVVSADDDTTCTLTSHPQRDKKLYLKDKGDPRDKWFYLTRDQVKAQNAWIDDDLVGEHEYLLGKPLSTLAFEMEGDLHLEPRCNHILDALQFGSGIIAATMSGIAGDSGMYTSSSFLRERGESQSRLCESEVLFKCAFGSREVLAVVRGRTVTHNSPCMAGHMGLANFTMLPPFFPIGKNQDGLFGILLRECTRSFLGHVPIAVYHDATGQRAYQRIPECRISDVVWALISSLVSSGEEAMPISLKFLGQGFLDIAKLPDVEFWRLVCQRLSKHTADRLRMTEAALRQLRQCPTYWAQEVADLYRQSVSNLQTPDWFIPIEFGKDRHPDLARSATKELVALAGALFYHWPDILSAAQILRQRGQRVSIPLT